jgi:transposase-like protein
MRPTNPALEALRVAALSDAAAVEFIEARRWNGKARCPRCNSDNAYAMVDRMTGMRERYYRWRCRSCKKQYSARTGTVMEESRLPLRSWVHAFWRACASKKGISALQLSRELNCDYKSALFILNRIRAGMSDWNGGPAPKMTGTVECDETYVGGKAENRHRKRQIVRTGRGTLGKQPVFGMVERGGDLRLLPVANVTARTLGAVIAQNADLAARFITDDYTAYRGLGKQFQERGHHVVRHSHGEYAAPNGVHSNTIESAFSLLKRGVMGTFHVISRKHLTRYCAEFSFRWNYRYVTDAERAEAAIKRCEGKRLTRMDVLSGTGA